jgi:hypothetical protein
MSNFAVLFFHFILVKYFPRDIIDFEDVFAKLKSCPLEMWESRYVLFLWCSVHVMNPFPLNDILDIRVALKIAIQALEEPGKTRDGSCIFLSRLLTRPDMKEYCASFLVDSLETVSKSSEVYQKMGLLTTMDEIFKLGNSVELAPFASSVLRVCFEKTEGNSMLTKLHLKICRRIALVLLKPRSQGWIYRKQQRNLFSRQIETKMETNDQDFAVPDGIEPIVHHLLSGLKHTNTIVRWSAAKGLARIAVRLPLKFAQEMVTSVIKLFSPLESDGIWHGACLSIAEFARFGIVRSEDLETIIPQIIKALEYDVVIGTSSVGANVRDAACYVFWTFARCFDPNELKPHVVKMATTLSILSCLDREVNVRRAASAAFQECVGRLGTIPNGLDIILKADYFSLANRHKSYTEIAPFVGSFEIYFEPMLNHLVTRKLIHWDKSIRVLSSKTLYSLAKIDPIGTALILDDFVSKILATETSPNNRHGYLLGLAEIIRIVPSPSLIAQIVPTIESKRLYRGKGGEMIREGVCRLIETLSISQVVLPEFIVSEGSFGRKTKKKTILIYQEVIEDNLKHPKEEISVMASDAFHEFCKSYLVNSDVVKRFCSVVEKETNPAVRRGFILALGKVPLPLISEIDPLFHVLVEQTKLERKMEDRDAETRRNAMNAIVSLCKTVPHEKFNQELIDLLFGTLLDGFLDYSTDSRGDIGSMVRQATIAALEAFVNIFTPTDSVWNEIIGNIIKEALEPMDQMREFAGEVLSRMIPKHVQIPHQKEMLSISNLVWRDPLSTFQFLTPLILHKEYTFHVFSGLILSFSATSHVKSEAARAILSCMDKIIVPFEAQLTQSLSEYAKDDSFNIYVVNMLSFLIGHGYTPTVKILEILIHYLKDHVVSDDVVKLLNMIPLITILMSYGNVYEILLSNLGSPFPKVRKDQAESLLLVTKNDDVRQILLKTNWTSSDIHISGAIQELTKLWKK